MKLLNFQLNLNWILFKFYTHLHFKEKKGSLEYQRTFSKRKLMRCESIIDLPHKGSGKGARRTELSVGKLTLGHKTRQITRENALDYP